MTGPAIATSAEQQEPRPHVLYAVTSPMTADLLLAGQLAHVRQAGFRVTLICSPGPELEEVARREGVDVVPIAIERGISPLRDLVSLVAIYRALRRLQPDLVHASTPKAGLLTLLAARLAGIRHRLYLVRGLRLETTRGPKRWLLAAMEHLARRSSTRLLAVSASVAKRYGELDGGGSAEPLVLANGSSNGVDAARFAAAARAVNGLRQELGLGQREAVIGFVGRVTRDKGISDLLEAFSQVSEKLPTTRLVLVGGHEEGDPISPESRARISSDPAIVAVGQVADSAPYYGLFDVLAFPSHREGFPNAPLEASAAGVPTVGFRVTGTVDAVRDGVTGRLVPFGDTTSFARALCDYLEDGALRKRHGQAARRRVIDLYKQETVWDANVVEFRRLLA